MSINACAPANALVRTTFSLHRPQAENVCLAFFLADSPCVAPFSPHPSGDEPRGRNATLVIDLLPLARVTPGLWQREVFLRPGWCEYLYFVDGEWLMDPQAGYVCPDGAGGFNAARLIARGSPATGLHDSGEAGVVAGAWTGPVRETRPGESVAVVARLRLRRADRHRPPARSTWPGPAGVRRLDARVR